MKWRDLKASDVVADRSSREVCLLLKKEGNMFTWFVLCGISHTAWGSNPYTVEADMLHEEIEGWYVYRAGEM